VYYRTLFRIGSVALRRLAARKKFHKIVRC
jgi:hypothetical protein